MALVVAVVMKPRTAQAAVALWWFQTETISMYKETLMKTKLLMHTGRKNRHNQQNHYLHCSNWGSSNPQCGALMMAHVAALLRRLCLPALQAFVTNCGVHRKTGLDMPGFKDPKPETLTPYLDPKPFRV